MDTSNAYGMNQDSEMTQTQPAYCASSVKPSREPEASVWGVLIPKNGINIEQQFDLSKTIYTIGRHKGCDITIPDARISKIHCTISSEYSLGRLKVYIEDSSANGTQVNHLTPLQTGQRMELNSGDEIYLCSTRSVASFIFINMSERFVNNRTTLRATFSEIFPKTSIRRVEDDYILGHEIGNGQCGHVHLCVHRFSKEKYACKIIDTSKFGIRPGLTSAELRQEAEILRSLDHPNIIKIIDSYEAEGILYIVMELMQGGDLFDRVNERRKYSEDASRKVTLNILSAVQYLHERKIIHRDLKPENILMVSRTDDTDIKITDFGLAKKANQEGLKTFCGTPQCVYFY
jgi:serine/threonine-protein kinase Chk2